MGKYGRCGPTLCWLKLCSSRKLVVPYVIFRFLATLNTPRKSKLTLLKILCVQVNRSFTNFIAICTFLYFSGDVIIEVENVTVEDDSHQMIVESLKNAGLTIRLVRPARNGLSR